MNKYPAQSQFQRINITLPQDTLRMLDSVAEKGERSRLMSDAVHFYVKEVGKKNLRKKLREGAVRRAERDLHMVQDWFRVENELWR